MGIVIAVVIVVLLILGLLIVILVVVRKQRQRVKKDILELKPGGMINSDVVYEFMRRRMGL